MILPLGLALWGFVVGFMLDRADRRSRKAECAARRAEFNAEVVREDLARTHACMRREEPCEDEECDVCWGES